MADVVYPARLVGSIRGAVVSRIATRFSGVWTVAPVARARRDFRHNIDTFGTVADRVILKSGASEYPFVSGRVWLLRLADGRRAWQGWSDSEGYYTATGLELGVEYIAVGIDPYRNQKATGAGPVTAT